MIIGETVDRSQWAQFVADHPQGNIFQTPEMGDVFRAASNSQPVFLAAVDGNGQILGVLLAQLQKFYRGLAGRLTARAVVMGGPLLKDDDPDVGRALLEGFDGIVSRRVVYSQFKNLWQMDHLLLLFGSRGYHYDAHLNILVDLTGGEERLWKGLSKARKEGVRKARRNNLSFDVTDSPSILPAFHGLLKNTYKKIGLPFPALDFFQALCDRLAPGSVKFFAVRKDGQPLTILAALVHKGVLYAYYIGRLMEAECLRMKPIDFLYWEVLGWGARNGCRVFDWLGAGKPDQWYGVRDFKLQYGGAVHEFGRYEKVYNKALMKLGTLGIKLKRKIH
jgi:lipid II:glycine glycyltransferase (peptidoglycan interpeptide bridge formation enzyme)